MLNQSAPAAHRWFDIKARAAKADEPKVADVWIYGNIGDRWNEDGVVASDLVRELSALDVQQIDVRINSYGGSVTDGMAILNALKRHPATVRVHVEGVAISCASYIAMAGDVITMAANAQMMVHAPWGVAIGNAAELREQAEVLDRYARAMAGAYADQTGMSAEDVVSKLLDGKDHWYSAEEAVAAGLADEVGEEVAIAASLASSFDLSRFRSPNGAASAAPRPIAANPQEKSMTEPVAAAKPADVPFARTKEQNAQVLALFKPFASQAGVQALQTEVLADPGLTVEQIQAKLLAKIGEGSEPANPQGSHPRVETVEDEADKRKEAIVSALCSRAGIKLPAQAQADMGRNPYRGLPLLEVARDCASRAGVRTAGMRGIDIVHAAYTQGTSDFSVILENVMHKTMQTTYPVQPNTWSRFCRRGTVSDFRAHHRYRLGSFGTLDSLTELGEFVNKPIPDAERSSISVSTKGNIINISRKAIVDDNLQMILDTAASFASAAARSIENDVYALLALNSGLGPTQADSQPLFHSNRANVGTGAALTTAAIDADAAVMALQKDVSGNDYLDLRPAVLLVPRALEGTARVVNGSEYDPDANSKLQRPNIVRGMFTDIVGSPRLTGNRRYLFADPGVAPVIEVAFLDGQEEPELKREDGFDVDGMRWRVRLDYGVAVIDYRGAVTNAGQ